MRVKWKSLNMSFVNKHLKIKGKVQGVGYRQNAFILAQKLGLTGWVKNTSEGDVEIVIEGIESNVSLFVEWCQDGPIHSVVTSVVILKSTSRDFAEFSDFTIRKTSEG